MTGVYFDGTGQIMISCCTTLTYGSFQGTDHKGGTMSLEPCPGKKVFTGIEQHIPGTDIDVSMTPCFIAVQHGCLFF